MITEEIATKQNNLDVLWAKKPKGKNINDEKWLPLKAHLNGAVEMAKLIWDEWVSKNVIEQIAKGISITDSSNLNIDNRELARRLFIFPAYTHDLGKASPTFQKKKNYPPSSTDEIILKSVTDVFLVKNLYLGEKEVPHALVSYEILRRHGFNETVAVIVGGHHGSPPNNVQINKLCGYKSACGFDNVAWFEAQDMLLSNALNISEISELTKEIATKINLRRPTQALLTGLLIMVDWIASDEKGFKLVSLNTYTNNIDSFKRAEHAFKDLAFPKQWKPSSSIENIYQERFNRIPRPTPYAIGTNRSCTKCAFFKYFCGGSPYG